MCIRDRIKRVRKFKYLGEIIQDDGLGKSAIEERIHKMQRAYIYLLNVGVSCHTLTGDKIYYGNLMYICLLYTSRCV